MRICHGVSHVCLTRTHYHFAAPMLPSKLRLVCLLKRVPPMSFLSIQVFRPDASQEHRRPRFSFLHLNCQRTDDGNRLGRSYWLTTARGSPDRPGLSLEFEETRTGSAVRPAVGLGYIFSPYCPVNSLVAESSQIIHRCGEAGIFRPDDRSNSCAAAEHVTSHCTENGLSARTVTKQPHSRV